MKPTCGFTGAHVCTGPNTTDGGICDEAKRINGRNNPRSNARREAFLKMVSDAGIGILTPKGYVSSNIDLYDGYSFNDGTAAEWYEDFDTAWRFTHGEDRTKIEVVETPVSGIGPIVELPERTDRKLIVSLGTERVMGSERSKRRREAEYLRRIEQQHPDLRIEMSSRKGEFQKGSDFRVFDAKGIIIHYYEGKGSIRDTFTPSQYETVVLAFEKKIPYTILVPQGHRDVMPTDFEPSGHMQLTRKIGLAVAGGQ